MKIAMVYPPMLVAGRPLDFRDIMGSPRGTTGSEIQILAMAFEMKQRDHDVTLFIDSPNAPQYDFGSSIEKPVPVVDLAQLGDGAGFDAVCVSLDMNGLKRVAHPGPLRVVFQQINGFEYGEPGFDSWTDLYVSVSRPHLESLKGWPTSPEKWVVIPNGCYEYVPEFEKEPGACVWISSPDRGLHHVLERWEEIRAAVPHATLTIYYFALERWLAEWLPRSPSVRGPWPQFPTGWSPHDLEHMKRAHSIDKLLGQPGVTVVGAASRRDIARALMKAEALLFPCDTIAWTEGFSCATLEGAAAGAVPVIMDCDALGAIYRGAVPVAMKGDLDGWTALAIRALTVPEWASMWRQRGREFAANLTWHKVAERFEQVLEERVAKR